MRGQVHQWSSLRVLKAEKAQVMRIDKKWPSGLARFRRLYDPFCHRWELDVGLLFLTSLSSEIVTEKKKSAIGKGVLEMRIVYQDTKVTTA